MSKFGRRIKNAPEGYEYIEPTIKAIENELRESKSLYTVNVYNFLCNFSFLR